MSKSTKKIFLVGCPRSGTTLLQSLLAAHSEITSFPESDFLAKVTSLKTIPRSLGIARRRAGENFSTVLKKIGCEHLEHYKPKRSLLLKDYVRSFAHVLDEATIEQGKSTWLEKTPRHLHFIEEIEQAIPDVLFIHIVRNGSDVVASMYEVTHKHPDDWKGARDIDTCINRWVDDVKLSQHHLTKSNHVLVRYEDLVERPKTILQNLCNFMDLDFSDEMLTVYAQTSQKVISSHEVWKSSVGKPIKSANSKKFYELFSIKERDYILRQTNIL